MSMRHQQMTNLPQRIEFDPDDEIAQIQAKVNKYIDDVNIVLNQTFGNIHHDLQKGQSRFEKKSAQWSISTLDEGMIGLYVSGGNEYLATVLSGVAYEVGLTALP